MISGFRHEVRENCAPLGYYVASGGNSLSTFRNYHYSLRNNPEEHSSREIYLTNLCRVSGKEF